jgi:hypothetical protein
MCSSLARRTRPRKSLQEAKFGTQRINVCGVIGEDAEDHMRFRIMIVELTELIFVI